jgi:hypothetical protein
MSDTATARKPKSKYAGQGYDALRKITDLPIRSRRFLAIGRNGSKIKPRKFHLNTAQLDQKRAEFAQTNVIPNPFNKGSYHFIVEALKVLGLDLAIKYGEFQTKVRVLMSASATRKEVNGEQKTAWERFRDKESRNQATGLDVFDRLEQNVRVLQRFGGVTPYGLKLNEVGTRVCRFKGLVIDLLKAEDGTKMIRLNTQSSRPTNEFKTRNVGAVKPVRKAPKRKVAKLAAESASDTTTQPVEAVASVESQSNES